MVEGKVFQDKFALQNGDRTYSEREFHKNYENVITALGGRKVNTSQYTNAMIAAAGGRDKIETRTSRSTASISSPATNF